MYNKQLSYTTNVKLLNELQNPFLRFHDNKGQLLMTIIVSE